MRAPDRLHLRGGDQVDGGADVIDRLLADLAYIRADRQTRLRRARWLGQYEAMAQYDRDVSDISESIAIIQEMSDQQPDLVLCHAGRDG